MTSADRDVVSEFVERQKWNKYFRHCVYGNEITKAKPEPEIYELALRKANVPPSLVAVIEDSPNGIKAAKCAGLFVVGLNKNNAKNELLGSGADVVISELTEIMPLLEARI